MTTPTTISFGNFLLQLGNGDGPPETFYTALAFTEKAFKGKMTTGETEVPDATNPDLPMWLEKEAKTLDIEVTGQGVLATADLPLWLNWWMNGATKNVRVNFNVPGAENGGYLQFPALITAFEPGAKKGEKMSLAVTIVQAGAPTWTANA